jgi:hypothetical protein
MEYRIIIDVFTIIWKGKQKVGFKLENLDKPLFVSPKFVFNNTGIKINEVELLIGSRLKPNFFDIGDKMFSGKIFQRGESKIVKSFNIIMDGSINELKIKNNKYLKNFKEIKKIFHFTRNNRISVGFDIGEEKATFISANWLKGLTTLDLDEIHILEGSFILPEYFEVGENIYEGMDKTPDFCRKSGVILKDLKIRFYGKIDEMHERFENSEPEYVTTYENYDSGYDSSNWLEDLAGTDDPEVMRDVYWNID